MELKRFDIANEIKTRTLLGGILGDKTLTRMIDCFKDMPANSTLLIDITEANVIDYNYCATSIGALFKLMQDGKFGEKHLIIKLDPDQKSNLLTGISWYLYEERTEMSSETFFREKNLSIKLLNSELDKIEFIGKMDELQTQILNIINSKMKISANDISKLINESVEEIIKKLNRLEELSFIFQKREGKEVFYCSFNSIFSGEVQS